MKCKCQLSTHGCSFAPCSPASNRCHGHYARMLRPRSSHSHRSRLPPGPGHPPAGSAKPLCSQQSTATHSTRSTQQPALRRRVDAPPTVPASHLARPPRACIGPAPLTSCCETHAIHACHSCMLVHVPGTAARIWPCDVRCAGRIGAAQICNMVWCICSSNNSARPTNTPHALSPRTRTMLPHGAAPHSPPPPALAQQAHPRPTHSSHLRMHSSGLSRHAAASSLPPPHHRPAAVTTLTPVPPPPHPRPHTRPQRSQRRGYRYPSRTMSSANCRATLRAVVAL